MRMINNSQNIIDLHIPRNAEEVRDRLSLIKYHEQKIKKHTPW